MPRRIPRPALVLLFAGVLAGVGYGSVRPRPGLVHALSREVRGQVVPGVRLSIGSAFLPCAPDARDGCGAEARPLSRRANALIDSAARVADGGTDSDALHAAGLANILFPDSTGKLLGLSVSYLQSASRLARHPAPVLADLAAAHLVRAQRTGSAYDLFQALEAAERALELEPRNRAARFNAAQALDAIGLRRQAAAAWAAYREVDPRSAWGEQARRRIQALSAPPPRVREPAPSAGAAELAGFAAAAPMEARDLGWDELLAGWAAAVLAGDTAAARQKLEQAAALGEALRARGGDASLADAVAAIRRRGTNGTALRRVAGAHAGFAAARRSFRETGYKDACPRFEQVRNEAEAGPLREWTRTFLGMCMLYGDGPAGDPLPVLRELAGAVDAARYPALAGRRRWSLGSALQGAGRYDEALAAYRQAEALFARAGEEEHRANMRMLLGNAYAELGDADSAYTSLHTALRVLGGRPGSVRLHNLLYALGIASQADGLPRAAVRMLDEAVAASSDIDPLYQAESRLARARLRIAAFGSSAAQDVAAAERLIAGLEAGRNRSWMVADLREARAAAWLAARPDRAAAELGEVIDHFAGEPSRLVPALFRRAAARLAQGRRDDAAADLRRAAGVLDSLRSGVSSAQLRASLLEASRTVFDRAVMLSVHAGRPDQALDYVERSRAAFAPVGGEAERAAGPLRGRPGEVGVELALVGDTLLAWTLRGTELSFTRAAVDREALVRDVERVRSALEGPAGDAEAIPALETLYERLIRPLAARLGPAGTPLVIVADGELAALPFAALRDRRGGRYLVQDHPIRFAASLRGPPPRGGPPAAGTAVTLVADPAFDRSAFRELQPLAAAAAEVEALRRHYRGARVLAGPRADTAALRAAFRRGGIAHFAGHAVFDDARPERSFLVAAPSGAGGAARLTAAEVERMELGGLRLVVLSACRTSRAQAGRSGGFAGLAGAFLAAGAGGVVGSLWQVDDGDTRVLMEAFHAAYLRTGDAAEALRQAQLGMLGSENSAHRSPAAWAGFRYAGG